MGSGMMPRAGSATTRVSIDITMAPCLHMLGDPRGMEITVAMESSHGGSKTLVFDEKQQHAPSAGPLLPPFVRQV